MDLKTERAVRLLALNEGVISPMGSENRQEGTNRTEWNGSKRNVIGSAEEAERIEYSRDEK